MDNIDNALQILLASLREVVDVGVPSGSAAARAGQRIFDSLETRTGRSNRPDPVRLPVCTYLGEALATVRRGPAALTAIAGAFELLEPHLAWHRRSGSEAVGPPFHKGHGNAIIIGPGGLEERHDVWVGVSLLAPEVIYPDHQHPPEEVYVVLSPGQWRQDRNPWVEPGLGGIIHNRPGVIHAMRAGIAPLFATWLLYAGN